MTKIRIIPRLDIKNDYVVKGLQMEGLRKLGDPATFAKKYYEDGADELILVDVVASYFERRCLFQIIKNICKEVFVPITVCGGVRTIEDMEELLSCGADKIGINSAAIKDPRIIKKASKKFGSQSIISSIEVKKYGDNWICYFDNGREPTEKKTLDWIKEVQDIGAGEILLTSVDKDGIKKGMDIELIEKVSNISKVPLIISGGVGKLSDLNVTKNCNVDGIAIASCLHYDILTINKIKKYLKEMDCDVRE